MERSHAVSARGNHFAGGVDSNIVDSSVSTNGVRLISDHRSARARRSSATAAASDPLQPARPETTTLGAIAG